MPWSAGHDAAVKKTTCTVALFVGVLSSRHAIAGSCIVGARVQPGLGSRCQLAFGLRVPRLRLLVFVGVGLCWWVAHPVAPTQASVLIVNRATRAPRAPGTELYSAVVRVEFHSGGCSNMTMLWNPCLADVVAFRKAALVSWGLPEIATKVGLLQGPLLEGSPAMSTRWSVVGSARFASGTACRLTNVCPLKIPVVVAVIGAPTCCDNLKWCWNHRRTGGAAVRLELLAAVVIACRNMGASSLWSSRILFFTALSAMVSRRVMACVSTSVWTSSPLDART